MEANDNAITLEQAKDWVRKFCDDRQWDPYHGAKDLAIGLVTEASELLEIFRFVPERELESLLGNPESRTQMADELADSLFFILRFAGRHGFDLSECLASKLIKNEKRYPALKKQL